MKPNRLINVGVVACSSERHPVDLLQAFCRLTLAPLLCAFCLVILFFTPAYAADGDLDPTFSVGSGQYQGVQFIPVIRGQSPYPVSTDADAHYNGYSLVFGRFFQVKAGTTTYNYNCIARITNTGALDTSFKNNVNLYGEVYGAYIYPHDDPNYADMILIFGNFFLPLGNSYTNGLARLKADGSLDTAFVPPVYGNGLTCLAVQSSGQILVGGYSMSVGDFDSGACCLARLNSNGSVDSNFTQWTSPGGFINNIVLNPDNPDDVRIYSDYPKPGGTGRYYLLQVDADVKPPEARTPLAAVGTELLDGPCFSAINLNNDPTKWVVCGAFKAAFDGSSFVTRNRVACFTGTGFAKFTSLDSYNVGVGPNGMVSKLQLMNTTANSYDDRVLAIGNFDTWNGANCGYIIRLDTNGSPDPSFTPGSAADDRIRNFVWNSNGSGGRIWGYFRSYSGTNNLGGFANLNANGTLAGYPLVAQGYGMGSVYSLATQPDGKILIGGEFNAVGGKYRQGFARINQDGSLDTFFKGGIDANGRVRSIAVQADGKILMAGFFGQIQSYARTSLARLNSDGSLDKDFFPPMVSSGSTNYNLFQVAPLSSGQMVVAGDMWSNNMSWPVGRVNSDGSIDTQFNNNASKFVVPGALNSWWYGTQVAVVGSKYLFTGCWQNETDWNAGGFLARFNSDGNLDTSFASSTAGNIQTMDHDVVNLMVQPSGWIVVSGGFTQVTSEAGSPARTSIAAFSPSGQLDTIFKPNIIPPAGANFIDVVALGGQPNGKVIIEENFFNKDDNNYNFISSQVERLNSNGSQDNTFARGSLAFGGWLMPGQASHCILRLSTGKALIGGNYGTYNGTWGDSLVRVFASPANFSIAPLFLLNE